MIIIPKSELFPNLHDVAFAEKDPDIITKELISLYESVSGRTLARADPVRLFIDAIILAVVQQRNIIDYSAKQNLLAYAEGDYLDHIGALLGVSRLEASRAATTLLFTLEEALDYDAEIPAGTRVSASDGKAFATVDTVTIPAGSLMIDEDAYCVDAGESGNGYVPGQVYKLVDVLPFGVSVRNVVATTGGGDIESDEAFRERIQIAPESFSVAGPKEAYRYFTKTADSDIIDVAVMGPPDTEPGVVKIYPLMSGGTLPSQEVIDNVLKVCSADDIRPDTDYVEVLAPVEVPYTVDMTYWVDLNDSVKSEYLQSAADQAVHDWILWQQKALGRDINPSELIHRVMAAGIKRCEVRSPVFAALKDYETAQCMGVNVVYGGLEKS